MEHNINWTEFEKIIKSPNTRINHNGKWLVCINGIIGVYGHQAYAKDAKELYKGNNWINAFAALGETQ